MKSKSPLVGAFFCFDSAFSVSPEPAIGIQQLLHSSGASNAIKSCGGGGTCIFAV